jgi:DNA-binding transcriptional MerR regulator
MQMLKIGELSKKSGLSIDAIRYYEKEGLLDKPMRSEGGFRKYPLESIDRIRFIKKAQSFGLTLSQIEQIMRESETGLENCCRHVNKIWSQKAAELEKQIRDLQAMRKGLRTLMKGWIPLREAKKKTYVVCPQIEGAGQRIKGGKRNDKKTR